MKLETLILIAGLASLSSAQPINRHALVSRHNVLLTEFDGRRPLQVGNGEFAFGMDITGLQTFSPFNTMSHWSWHSGPPPQGQRPEDFQGKVVETHGRPVPYPLADPERPVLSQWLSSSPHRVSLGRVGMILLKADGTPATAGDLQNPRQSLDLWTGLVTSRFEIEGIPVTVTTAGHPTQDGIGVRVSSPLIRMGRLSFFLSCPGNNPLYQADFVGDWANPGTFNLLAQTSNRADFRRTMDEFIYSVSFSWQGAGSLKMPSSEAIPLRIVRAEYGARDKWADVTSVVSEAVRNDKLLLRVSNATLKADPIDGVVKHLRVTYQAGNMTLKAEASENEDLILEGNPDRSRIRLVPNRDLNTFSFTCTFSPAPITQVPDANTTFASSQKAWPAFWKSGGALDLSGSSDPRWKELERRVVLSQYLMAVNEAGSYPPQESGLVNNSWYGRFHMEMVWWHAAHWALWDRWTKANQSLDIYAKLLPQAKEFAKGQGYAGARWPKAIGPNGREWPHEVHAFLIWQQPHPIFFAELDYRAHPSRATLEKWWPVIEATADFMSDYAFYDKQRRQSLLGPPVHAVSENVDPYTTQNPTFELGYWRYGLRTAQEWRKRMGHKPNAKWASTLSTLAPLPVEDGVYVLHEGVKDMWTKFNFEHPALIGPYGMLPGDGVDRPTMARTLSRIRETWNFNHIWGWDFPMLAMCAARLGQPEQAIEFLLHPSPGFQFDARGLATGGPFPYFPSNGGLLYAVAMMAAGWDGAPQKNAPGFPAAWKVRWEGMKAAP